MSGSFGRNLGLVVALLLICAAGVITAGDRFASIDNTLTILRFASTIGVVSIGMTFVITGGGIDLSVGAILALCSVWATTFATQTMAGDTHWLLMVFVALAVGCRLRARQRSADRLRQGRPVHHDAGDARCRARSRRDHLRAAYADRDRRRLQGLLLRRRARRAVPGHHLRGRLRRRLGPVQPHDVRPAHARRGWQPRGRTPGRHQRQPPHRDALRARRVLLRARRPDAGEPHHDRKLDPRHAAASSTSSRPSSSAAPCSPEGAGPSSAPSSACSSSPPWATCSPSTTRTPRPRPSPRA